jgi:endoglucanase
MIDLLKQLCEINGTSGDEDGVAGFLTDYIEKNIHPESTVVRRDNLGNLLVYKKGRHTPAKKIMFTAHMDEVGFIITGITKEGFLHFAPVGGINANVVFGRRVVFGNGTVGVIAGKPVHLLDKDEKDKQPKIEELLIDIGASDKKQAEAAAVPGDYCYFAGEFEEIENFKNLESHDDRLIRSKALDNRLGCAVMLDMMKNELNYDCVFAFTVQEEVGCRGAGAAAFNLEPDICVVLESTTACDTPDAKDDEKVCELGAGPVVSFMDKGTVYDRKLYGIAVETAKENNIKIQSKSKIVGGNDASVLHKSAGGIRTIAVCVPCRYLHTPLCIANNRDIVEMRRLAEKLLYKLAAL